MTVVPVKPKINHVYPFQTLLPADETGLDVDAKAHAEQVRAVAVEPVGASIGNVPFHLMDQLDDVALRRRPLAWWGLG